MHIPERVGCSRFPAGSVPLSSLARAGGVTHRATATGGATKLAITIWIFAVTVRLILINQPYIDHWSWRQCDRLRGNGISHFAVSCGYLLQICWHPRMDWTLPGCNFLGRLAAIFVLARSGNLREYSRRVGDVFL